MAIGQESGVLPAGAPDVTAQPNVRSRISLEIVLEITLIVLVGAVFAYMFIDSLGWHPDVARLPRISSGVGLFVLALYVARRVRRWGQLSQRGAILDLGFDEEGLDRRTILLRTARFVGTTTALFLGCWLIGFHTAIPLYVFGYLVLWGNVRWYWAALAAAFFVAYMVVTYDLAIHAQWPEPLFGPFDK